MCISHRKTIFENPVWINELKSCFFYETIKIFEESKTMFILESLVGYVLSSKDAKYIIIKYRNSS